MSQFDPNRGCLCPFHHKHVSMKSSILTCLLLASAPVQAQQQEVTPVAPPATTAEKIEVSRAAPSIIGPLAGEPRPAPVGFAPPPPPRLSIPAQNTLTSRTHDFGDHTVTIQEVIPVALPPRPATKAPPTEAQKQAFLQSRPARPKIKTVNFSTTVYDHIATVIEWHSKDRTRSFRAWSNIDFNYIRGIHNIQHGDTHLIYFYFGIGNVDTRWMASRFSRFKWVYQKPVIPELPASPETNPTFVVVKGDPGPEDLEGLQVLHDLYKAEHPRLKAAAEYQKIQNELHAAELRANPPKAPDIIIKHWSISNQLTVPAQKGEPAR